MAEPSLVIYLMDIPASNLAAFDVEINGKSVLSGKFTVTGMADPMKLQAVALNAASNLLDELGAPDPTSIATDCAEMATFLKRNLGHHPGLSIVNVTERPEGHSVH